ncbi:peptidoglycan-binding protein LysM [Brachybacterium sp. DNPG3]
MQTHMTIPTPVGTAAQQARIIALPVRREATSTFAEQTEASSAPQARAHVRLEITARGRTVVTVLAFLLGLLVATLLILVLDVPSALAGQEAGEGEVVTVAQGDTLWGYAEEFAPEGVSAQEYIAEVRTLNHLPTGRVTAGQSIVLPSAESLGD